MHKKIIISALCAAAMSAGAQAQAPGSGVRIKGDAKISVQQDKAVTTAAIGQRVKAHTAVGSIVGNVDIDGKVTIDVRQKGAVTTVAIGQDAAASTVVGTIASEWPN